MKMNKKGELANKVTIVQSCFLYDEGSKDGERFQKHVP